MYRERERKTTRWRKIRNKIIAQRLHFALVMSSFFLLLRLLLLIFCALHQLHTYRKMLRSHCSTLAVGASDISSKRMQRMSVNVIFSIVYCMHFIWYFIVGIARSRQIRCLNRLSNRGFVPKRIFLHFSQRRFFSSLQHRSLSLSLLCSHLLSTLIRNHNCTILKSRSHTNYALSPYSIILLYAICINTTQSRINQAKPNQTESIQ